MAAGLSQNRVLVQYTQLRLGAWGGARGTPRPQVLAIHGLCCVSSAYTCKTIVAIALASRMCRAPSTNDIDTIPNREPRPMQVPTGLTGGTTDLTRAYQ